MSDLNRRLGTIRFDGNFPLNNTETLAKIMSGGVVISIRHIIYSGQLEYTLMHPLFDVIPEGYLIKRYSVIMEQKEGKFESFKFECEGYSNYEVYY